MTREEAIKKIRQMSLPKETMEIFEALAPELRESEDERIRKNCIHFLELQKSYHASTIEIDECIAWLEKQQEQKPADEQFSSLEGLDAIKAKYYDEGFKNGFDEGVESVKPTEWSEEDEKMNEEIRQYLKQDRAEFPGRSARLNRMIGWLIYLRPQPKQEWSGEDEKMWKKTQKHLEDYIREFDPYHSKQGRDVGTCLSWLKSFPERFNLQLKQEWKPAEMKDFNFQKGEPDEKAISRLSAIIWFAAHFATDVPQEEAADLIDWVKNRQHFTEWSEEDIHCIELLDTIIESSALIPKNRIKCHNFLKYLRSQPKIEWSEEDEKMRKDILRSLECYQKMFTSERIIEDINDEIFWFKSLRPSWKPSKEQMEELGKAKDIYMKSSSGIASLYYDLITKFK